MPIVTKNIKTNSHEIKTKTKQLNLYFIRKDMGLVPNLTVPQVNKREQIRAKLKNIFPFLKTINFTVINVIRYQQCSLQLEFSFIST